MEYSIEIYLDGEDTADFLVEGPTAFPTLSAGDIIQPMWREGAVAFGPGDRCRVDRVEHMIWEKGYKLMVYGERVLADRPGAR